MNSYHPLVIGLVIFVVSGCTEAKLARIALENASPAIKLLGNTIDGAVKLFKGQKNKSTTKTDSQSTTKTDSQSTTKTDSQSTTKTDSQSTRIKDTQLCVYSTSGFGKNWETNPVFKSKVQKAKRKGLTLADCARLLSG
jgi:phage-related protein